MRLWKHTRCFRRPEHSGIDMTVAVVIARSRDISWQTPLIRVIASVACLDIPDTIRGAKNGYVSFAVAIVIGGHRNVSEDTERQLDVRR